MTAPQSPANPPTDIDPILGRLVLVVDCHFPLTVSPVDAQAILDRATDAVRREVGSHLKNVWVAANDGAQQVLDLIPPE